MQTVLWALIVGLCVVAIVVPVVSSRRSRRQHLRERFGPEYERALEELGAPALAERNLEEREKRVRRLRIGPLNPSDAQEFAGRWSRIQKAFIDDPIAATTGADALLVELMRAQGYPDTSFDQRLEDLSVHHAKVVQHYRAAQALASKVSVGQATTEELRQALIHFRAIFADLLDEPVDLPVRRLLESQA